jgi:hypothetical protein
MACFEQPAMKTNVTPLDRGARAGLGMLLLLTPLLELPTFPYNLIGIVPLVTGLAGICPLYSLFGRRSHAAGAHAT